MVAVSIVILQLQYPKGVWLDNIWGFDWLRQPLVIE